MNFMTIQKAKIYGSTMKSLSAKLFSKTPDGWQQSSLPKKVFKLRWLGVFWMIKIQKEIPNG